TGPAVGGGDEADIELTGTGSAIDAREVVVDQPKMGRAARRTPVDAQARKEIIDATAHRVGRNALGQGPVDAIGRGDQQEVNVAGIAGGFKPAVCPDDVHSARLVNFSGGQVRRANAA